MRQLMLELEQPLTADTPICEHDLTLEHKLSQEHELTLDQLTEWDLQFTEEFSRDMYTRVRENARSMYVLMREILPIFDLLVEKGELAEKGERDELPEPYIARIHERLKYFLRDCLTSIPTNAQRRVQAESQEKILPRIYQQDEKIANRRNRQ